MIRLRSSGDREPPHRFLRLLKLLRLFRERFSIELLVADKQFQSVFVCEAERDMVRPATLWTKEPATMKWLDEDLRPGDHFLDIGANIGIYSIAAAHRVGSTGMVYSFEPHKPNGLTLMRNVAANGFHKRIKIFPLPLSSEQTPMEFNYANMESGTTGSQLGTTLNGTSRQYFEPVNAEVMLATTVDWLIEAGAMQPPQLIKLDVDGIELAILRGMKNLLTGSFKPRSLQVEINAGEHAQIESFMRDCGYAISSHGFTKAGEALRQAGRHPDDIAHNVIFRPSAAVT